MTETIDAPASAPRRSGKPLAIGLLVLIAGGVAFALSMWFWGREPHGPIAALAPVDGSRVAVLRQGFEERGYTHLGVWNAEGEMVWSEALFGVQDDPGLSVAADRVLVLVTEARGNPALHAFDLETGAFEWKVAQEPEGAPSSYGASLAVGETVAWLLGPGRTIRVVDLASGEVRATVEPAAPADVAYVLPEGDRLALVGLGSEGAAIDRDGGVEPLSDYPESRVMPMTRDGDQLCLGHPPERCRRVEGLEGYAAGDGVVWIHSQEEIGVLRAEDLAHLSGSLQVGELRDR